MRLSVERSLALQRRQTGEWMRRIGTLPLVHQPGEDWMYDTGIQVLGVLVERAAGKPLEEFLRARPGVLERDVAREQKFGFTFAPRGYLIKT